MICPGAGGKVIFAGLNFYPRRTVTAGLTPDGGAAQDRQESSAGIGADTRLAALLNFRALTVYQGRLGLSADQIGKGLI